MQNKAYQPKKRNVMDVDQLIEGILAADIQALSRGITLIESRKAAHFEKAQKIIEACLPHAGKALRVGITGVPGVGKSTFIEAFGSYLIENHGLKVAVLAIDPSSQRTKGSILGDKTRMNQLSTNPKAFVRPSPTAGSLGGVSHHTRESIILCEAASYDVILVETVGVGQSETEVKQMTDFFLLLMLAGAGDELQGIKRGIMEMADAILINKADGENRKLANQAVQNYRNAVHLFPPSPSSWNTRVGNCSALEGMGLEKTWEWMSAYREQTQENGYFEQQRQAQRKQWLESSLNEAMKAMLLQNESLRKKQEKLEKEVIQGRLSPRLAAVQLLQIFQQ